MSRVVASVDELEAKREEFPASESWWPVTSTRTEWSSAPRDSPLKPSHRQAEEMKKKVVLAQNPPKAGALAEKQCKVTVESRKVFYSASLEATGEPRSCEDEEQCIVPTSGRPMVIHVNCGVERFENLRNQFNDVFDATDESTPIIQRTAILTKRIKKTLSKLAEGQHELVTEWKYSFPMSAKVVFRVATGSENDR